MIELKIQLNKTFAERLKGRLENYDMTVGILKDGKHYLPKQPRELKNYAGGEVRKIDRNAIGPVLNISTVSKKMRQYLGFNYLREPFTESTSDVTRFLATFFNYAFGRSTSRRLENTLQAVVRNPILRGEYYIESERTIKEKGFSRPMIDTGQLFQSIKAEVKKK